MRKMTSAKWSRLGGARGARGVPKHARVMQLGNEGKCRSATEGHRPPLQLTVARSATATGRQRTKQGRDRV